MARTELPNGVILPAEYSDDWYDDMTSNLTKLDDVIGSDSEKLNADGMYFLRMSSAALTDSGTGSFSDLNSSYKIKTGDLVLDSGRKLYQIVSVDSANETFTVGNSLFKVTAESDLAAVAESGDYDDLTNKPSYGVLRMTSETLSNSGSGAISNLNSDSKLTAGDYVLDAALKVFLITAVSAPNYTVGTVLFQVTDTSVLAAVATSGNYDDLNNIPTYGITRFVNTAITDNSNVAFANISSVDKIKAGDFLLDNAGKMYLIASVDTVNETAAVTTPLTVLALDADVLHKSGNETAAGQKTFLDGVAFSNVWTLWNNPSVTKGTVPQSTQTPYRLYFGGTSYGASFFTIDTSVGANGVQTLTFRSAENVVSGDDTRMILTYDPNRVQPRYLSLKGGIEPNANNTYECGTSSNKWKTFNGITPGVLSFPDLSAGLDISSYISVPNAVTTYTPSVDGWISIILKSTSGALGCFIYQGDFADARYGETALPNESEPCVMLCTPVFKGGTVNIATKGSNAYVYSAKFYPCLGNV